MAMARKSDQVLIQSWLHRQVDRQRSQSYWYKARDTRHALKCMIEYDQAPMRTTTLVFQTITGVFIWVDYTTLVATERQMSSTDNRAKRPPVPSSPVKGHIQILHLKALRREEEKERAWREREFCSPFDDSARSTHGLFYCLRRLISRV